MEFINNLTQKIKDIYLVGEDKWYGILDKIDEKVPVYPVIDKVDAIIPSFALFLTLTLILIILIVFALFAGSIFEPQVEVIVIVTADGLPIAGAEVMFSTDCETIGRIDSVETNSDGEAIVALSLCPDPDEHYTIGVFKQGFDPLSEDVSISGGETFRLSLSPVSQSLRDIYATVSDQDGNPILGVSLEMVCLDNLQTSGIGDGNNGTFSFQIIEDCSTVQVRASAIGYDDAIASIDRDSERIELVMEESAERGSALFETTSSKGPVSGAEITLTDAVGKTYTLFTDNAGVVIFENLLPQAYSYTAMHSQSGESSKGSFILNPRENEEIEIMFTDVSQEAIDTRKRIYVKIVDEDENPIAYASTTIFKDGNVYTASKSTDTLGELTVVVSDENSAYVISINKMGYQLTIKNVELKSKDDEPQKIVLRQGGAKLKVNVVDEDVKAVLGAQIEIYLAGFDGYLLSSPTAVNGEASFDNLPSGSYTIKARKLDSDGEAQLTLGEDDSKEITISMVIGKGKIGFNLKDIYFDKLNVDNYEIDAERNGTFILVKDGSSLRYYYETDEEKHGTVVKTRINDSNYFPYESLEYTVFKGTSANKKDLMLRELGDLSNDSKVQMFLQQVYGTNPTGQGTPKKATKIEPGERYYMLFHVILNPEFSETNELIANFVVGPKDENTLLDHNPFTIDNVVSISNSAAILTDVYDDFEINRFDEDVIVDGIAKQANLLAGEVSGPKQVPILLTIDVDENAETESLTELIFEARWGNTMSFTYSKEFEIGKKFCMGEDCPAFLFSNYLRWDSQEEDYVAVSETKYPVIYMGDTYTMRTIIENKRDEAFEAVDLKTWQSTSSAKILFNGDANIIQKTNMAILEESAPLELEITTISTASSLKIKQLLSKYVGATDFLEDYEGIENQFRVKVLSKDQIKLVVDPKNIYAGAEYPMFVIKTTNNTLKEDLQTNWTINLNGASDNLYTGTTDENGLDITQVDATNLVDGDILTITAYASGMLSDSETLVVEGRTPTPEPEIIECLTIDKSLLNLSVGGTGSFTIDSNSDNIDCQVARSVYIQSDQYVSPKQFTLEPGAEQIISVTGTARNGVLGIYPLQVLSINGSRYSQIGFMDVIVSDSSASFSMSDVIFDFTSDEGRDGILEGVITNNYMANNPSYLRQDIYYPKINLSTNSTALSFTKTGIPAVLTVSPVVFGSAIESIIYGQIKADATSIEEACGEDSDPVNTKIRASEIHTSGILSWDEVKDVCEDYVYKGEYTEKEEPTDDKYSESTTTNSTDYTPSEIIGEEGSASTIIGESEENSAETASKKEVKRASFATINSGAEIESGFPVNMADHSVGDWGFFELGGAPDGYASDGDTCGTLATNNKCGRIGGCEGSPGGKEICNNPAWQSGYSLEYRIGQMHDLYGNLATGAPRPPGWSEARLTSVEALEGAEWTTGRDLWAGGGEVGVNTFHILEKSIHGGPVTLERANYIGGGEFFIQMQVKGNRNSLWSKIWGSSACDTSKLKMQFENARVLEFLKEQRAEWTDDFSIVPVEGKIYTLGGYSATPSPQWTNEDTGHGAEVDEEWNIDGTYSRLGIACVAPNKFVDPETHSSGEEVSWTIRDPNDWHVEYDSTGNIMYWLAEDTIPEGVDMWLRYGEVKMKYMGVSTENSEQIPITLTKSNLFGDEYAIVTIKDWTGDSTTEMAYQVKLVGPKNNCYHSNGTAGFTGEEFSPRLLFNWDWDSIDEDQCDYKNGDYTYCDATQFTMELMQKIRKIDEYYVNGQETAIGTISAFHSYLVKDNYSADFLNDFAEYYNNAVVDTPIWFLSGGSSTGFEKFITENRIRFEGGDLPYAGLYTVSIEVIKDNPLVASILDSSGPNAEIIVRFKPYQRAPNYNPFYETPFDGPIGTDGSREGYGTSVSGPELILNWDVDESKITTAQYSNAMKNVTFETSNSLNALNLDNGEVPSYGNSGMILTYDSSTGTLEFNPSQPTPVVMTVDGSNSGSVSASYTIKKGTLDLGSSPSKAWQLIGSTIGSSTCHDFEDKSKSLFIDSGTGSQKSISWNGNKTGTLELATVYYTPFERDYAMSPANSNTTLNSFESLYGAGDILLDYYYGKVSDVESLKRMFELVEDEKVCMSKSSESELQLWWNPDYVQDLVSKVDTSAPACN